MLCSYLLGVMQFMDFLIAQLIGLRSFDILSSYNSFFFDCFNSCIALIAENPLHLTSQLSHISIKYSRQQYPILIMLILNCFMKTQLSLCLETLIIITSHHFHRQFAPLTVVSRPPLDNVPVLLAVTDREISDNDRQ